MKENGREIEQAQQLMQELMQQQNGSDATWSVIERFDGVHVQKEKPSGEIILYSLTGDEESNPSA